MRLITSNTLQRSLWVANNTTFSVGWWCYTLQWRHNEHDGVSNHQHHDRLLNRLFSRRSKKPSKLRVTGLCAGNSSVNSPRIGPVTRKRFPFDDVIMSKVRFLWSIIFSQLLQYCMQYHAILNLVITDLGCMTISLASSVPSMKLHWALAISLSE